MRSPRGLRPFVLACNLAALAFLVALRPAAALPCCDLNQLAAAYEARTFTFPGRSQSPMPYRLLQPKTPAPGRTYPLIVFLHGWSYQGTDNRRQLDGMQYTALFDPNKQTQNPAFIVAPQIPVSNHVWGYEPDGIAKASTWPNDAIPALVDHLASMFPVDTNRVYLTGLSMGGAGTWDILARNVGKFAAGVVATGVANLADAPSLVGTPIWSFMNRNDGTNPATGPRYPNNPSNVYFGPRDMANALRTAGAGVLFTEGAQRTLPAATQRHVYTEYTRQHADVGDNTHNCWYQAYNEPTLPAWLFAQRLDAAPAPDAGGGSGADAGAAPDARVADAGGGGPGGAAGSIGGGGGGGATGAGGGSAGGAPAGGEGGVGGQVAAPEPGDDAPAMTGGCACRAAGLGGADAWSGAAVLALLAIAGVVRARARGRRFGAGRRR